MLQQRRIVNFLATFVTVGFLVAVALPASASTAMEPNLTLSADPISTPWDVAIGPDGNLYVTDLDSDGILVYPLDTSADTAPTAILHTKRSDGVTNVEPYGLAFAPDGKLFVTGGGLDTVYIYDPISFLGVSGTVNINASSTTLVLSGDAFDVAFHGGLVIASSATDSKLFVYDDESLALFAIFDSPTGLSEPNGLAIVGNHLVVSNNSGIASGGGMISRFLLADILSAGDVSAPPTVTLSPTSVIDGGQTTLFFTDYVVADCENNLVVTNYGNGPGQGSIAVFDPDAQGDVAPRLSVLNPAPGLHGAEGLVVDDQNRVWVAVTSGSVQRFDSIAASCSALPNTGAQSGWFASLSAFGVMLSLVGLTAMCVAMRRRSPR